MYGDRRCRRPRGAELASLLAAVCALLVGCSEPAPARNVVLIVVDTLRADHLGLYGYERSTSPHLDRQAERGVVFERAFTTSPWTIPAFGSMLTGLLPSVHGGGLRIEGAKDLFDRSAVDQDVVNVAQRLRAAGFATSGIVGNPLLRKRFGTARGFDRYRRFGPRTRAKGVVELALTWIGEAQEDRFFMMLHFMDPHSPHAAPPPYRGRFTGGAEARRPPSLGELRARGAAYTDSDREAFVGLYDEEIAYLDNQLKRLFDGLGDRWSDTLVVLTSDHGEDLDRDSFFHGHTMRQELLHVPLILWAPGMAPRRVSTPVSVLDIAPTILDAVGEQAGVRTMAGRSLLGLLSGTGGAVEQDQVAEVMLHGAERKALIRWPYKLVVAVATGERRLVDLQADPGEQTDLSATLSDLADRMEAELGRRLAGASPRPGAQAVELDDKTRRELEALGYVN